MAHQVPCALVRYFCVLSSPS